MKISTKNTEVLCLTRISDQCKINISNNTLQLVEKFTYFWVVFTSDGRKNRELDIRIGKANAVLRELYRAVIKTGYFQLPQNFTFQIGLCSDPRLWS